MTTPQHPDPMHLRNYALKAFDIGEDGEESVELIVDLPTNPDIRAHVSLAGLFLLAIMTLDQDETIERRMEELVTSGPINEVDAANQIQFLLLKEANDQRV